MPFSLKEHLLPGVRYFFTTFMRGGWASRKARPRWGLAHILRRQADLYVCGHQHLMAHMQLRPSKSRPSEETHCHFAIVGNSSKTEQDVGDFDDELPASAPGGDWLGWLSWLSGSLGRKDANAAEGGGHGETPATPALNPKRYATEWASMDTIGFALAEVSEARFKLTFFAVPRGQGEAQPVHELVLSR